MTSTFRLPLKLQELRNYVDGEFVATGRTFPNISPVDGSVLAHVHEADAALVDRAVQSARRAMEGPWGKSSPEERARLLHRVADIIESRHDEFVVAEVADTGRPVEQAKSLDVYRAVDQPAHLRRPRQERPWRSVRDPDRRRRPAELHGAQAARRRGQHPAVEPADPVDDLEGRSRTDLRQRADRQALRGNAVFSGPAGRGFPRSRRAQGGVPGPAWLRPRLGRRGPDAPPRRRRHHLYRRIAYGLHHHEGWPRTR